MSLGDLDSVCDGGLDGNGSACDYLTEALGNITTLKMQSRIADQKDFTF